MPRSSQVLMAFLCVGAIGSRTSWASEVEVSRATPFLHGLSYEAPPECPNRERFEKRVHELLSGAIQNDAPPRIDLRIRGLERTGYSVALRVGLQSGEGLREFGGESCEQLVEASAWMVAFVLNPELETTTESAAVRSFPLETNPQADGAVPLPEPGSNSIDDAPLGAQDGKETSVFWDEAGTKEGTPQDERPLPANPSTPKEVRPLGVDAAPGKAPPRNAHKLSFVERGRGEVGVAGVVDVGTFRTVTPGVAAVTGLYFDAWNPQMDITFLPTKTVTEDELSGKFWMLVGALRLCRRTAFRAVSFALCAGLQGGVIHGVANADNPRPQFGPWVAPVATLGLVVPLGSATRRIFAAFRTHGVFPLIRDEYQQDSLTIYRPPAALVRLEMGVEYHFE